MMAALMTTSITYPFKTPDIMASGTYVKNIAVIDNHQYKEYDTAQDTIEHFFTENNITLNTKDACDYEASDKISENMIITITRAIAVTISIDGIFREAIHYKRRDG